MHVPVKERFAELGLLYSAAIWGATFITVKGAVEEVDPLLLVALRFTLAAAVIGIPLAIMKKSIFRNWPRGIILGVVLWSLYSLQTVGLRYTTASNSGFITGLFIAFLPPLYFVFHRRLPGLWRQVAVAVSLLGLWCLTGGLSDINFGDLLTVASAFAYALHIMVADRFIKEGGDPYVLSFQQFLTVGLLGFAASFGLRISWDVQSHAAYWVIVFLALFPTLSAFLIQLMAQRFTSPVKVSLIFASEPLWAAVFAWSLGGETLTLIKAVGGGLIVLAIVISEFPFQRSPRGKQTDLADPA